MMTRPPKTWVKYLKLEKTLLEKSGVKLSSINAFVYFYCFSVSDNIQFVYFLGQSECSDVKDNYSDIRVDQLRTIQDYLKNTTKHINSVKNQ